MKIEEFKSILPIPRRDHQNIGEPDPNDLSRRISW